MKNWQTAIKNWLIYKVREPEQFESLENRMQRFYEEATELIQAGGLSEEKAIEILRYSYNRPVGKVPQEIGGTFVTFLVLVERLGYDAYQCMLDEYNRIQNPEIIQKVRDAIIRKREAGVGI